MAVVEYALPHPLRSLGRLRPEPVQQLGGDAEQVLHRERDPQLLVILHLPDAHEEIAVFVGVVERECRKEVRARFHLEDRILFCRAEAVGVLELHHRRGAADRVHIPAVVEQRILERLPVLFAERALQDPDPLRAQLAERGGQRANDRGMHPTGLARAQAHAPPAARRAGQVHLDGYRLAANLRADAADLVEHALDLGQHVHFIAGHLGNRDRQSRRPAGRRRREGRH